MSRRLKTGLQGQPVAAAAFEVRDDWSVRPKAGAGAAADRSLPELLLAEKPKGIWLFKGDCLELLDAIAETHGDGCFDVVVADPPYFLSNGGITCHAGRLVKVDKGSWDKSAGAELNHEFNLEWLRRCQRVLKPDGTLWVSGTHHVIFSIGFAMQQLGFKR